jgi:hypothetical protein
MMLARMYARRLRGDGAIAYTIGAAAADGRHPAIERFWNPLSFGRV